MPDKYGFKTDAERRDEARRLREASGLASDARTRRFGELDPIITDILGHFGAAIRPGGALHVTADAIDGRWTVRPSSPTGWAPPLLDLQLGTATGGVEHLDLWDLGVDDPHNLRILVDVLHAQTGAEVHIQQGARGPG